MSDENQNPKEPVLPQEPEDEMLEFIPVGSAYQVQGGAQREESGCIVSRTGRIKFNVSASESTDQLALRNGLELGKYALTTGANPTRNLVALYTVDTTADKAQPIRRNPERQYSSHIGAVFAEYPQMRPVGTRWCPVSLRKDAKGKPCLVISLQAGLPTQTIKRGNSGKNKAEATKTQPPDNKPK